MKKRLSFLFFMLLFSLVLFLTGFASAATINAASCSQSAVQTAITSASSGDTINVPAGSCTWSNGVSVTKSLSIIGAGPKSTLINLNGVSPFNFDVSNGFYKLEGFGFSGSKGGNGVLNLDGINSNISISRINFNSITGSGYMRYIFIGYTNYQQNREGSTLKGVIHSINATFSSGSGALLMIYGDNKAWERADGFSSDDFIYIENNYLQWPSYSESQSNLVDGEHGARFVIRNNRLVNGYIEWHDTGSTGGARSTRAFVIYNNNLSCTSACGGWRPISLRGGTGMVYNNNFPVGAGFDLPPMPFIYRVQSGGSGAPWVNSCDGTQRRVCSTFYQFSPSQRATCYWPTQYGDCTNYCTSDSQCPSGERCVLLDGASSNGYPCRDQLGRGMDDPVTSVQASSPMYYWNNKDLSGNILLVATDGRTYPNYVRENRDYYMQATSGSFIGTSGVGTGLLSARPSTCTTGVGYFATDQKILYRCSATNTWSPYYTEYQYPHPLAGSSSQTTISDILPENRTIDWSVAGVNGGIPIRNTICATFSPGASASQIEGALGSSNCTNKVVFLNAGNYSISQIRHQGGNVTLRGAGAGRTVIRSSGYQVLKFDGAGFEWPPAVLNVNVLSGATKGSNMVTLASTSGIVRGNFITIGAGNNPSFVHNLGVGGQYGPSEESLSATFIVRDIVGSNVYFDPPLPFDFTPYTPRVAIHSGTPINYLGIENLTVDLLGSGNIGIDLEFVKNSWIKGVEVKNAGGRGLYTFRVLHTEIRDSYFHSATGYGPNTEGMDIGGVDNCWNLIENNIVYDFGGIIIGDYYGGNVGNVIAYNYAYDTDLDGNSQVANADIDLNHGSNSFFNLVEGNIVGSIDSDGWYGSDSHGMIFRNWVTADDTNPIPATINLYAIELKHFTNYYNIIGNVLGTSNFPSSNSAYRAPYSSYSDGLAHIYEFGFPWRDTTSFSGTIPATNPPNYAGVGNTINTAQEIDMNVEATLIRYGNYDYYHDCVWNDALNRCWTAGELSSLSLPNSLYLSSKPSFFGTLSWPPFSPNSPGTGNIPAKYCYDLGLMPNCLSTGSNPTPVNGACGSTQNSCTSGTLNDIADNSTSYLWQCVGSGGGSTASCSLLIPVSVPTISVQPVSQSKYIGESVTFSVTASGNPTPIYQWRENGVNISGATSSSYTKSNVQLADSGKVYSVVVRNSQGSVTSSNAVLTVTDMPQFAAPSFIGSYNTSWGTASPKTTQSFAVVAGDVLVAYSAVENNAGTVDVSGGNLNWALEEEVSGGSIAHLYLWTATVDSDKTMNVTFTDAGADSFGGSVYQFRGSNGTGSSVSTSGTGAPSLNIATTALNSSVVVANVDYAANSGSSRTWRTNAGTFVEREYFLDAVDYTVYGGYHPRVNSVGSYAVGLTAPTQTYSIAAIEIKGTENTVPSANYHPADSNQNGALSSAEVSAYVNSYFSGSITMAQALYAVTLLQQGGDYTITGSSNCAASPWNCWTS